MLQQPAKGQLAVGRADRFEAAVQQGRVVFKVAIVGKHPITSPQFTYKRVAVFKRYLTDSGFAHVGDHVVAFDRVSAQHLGNRRGGGAFLVNKVAHAFTWLVGRTRIAFKKGDTPAIGVVIGAAAALGKSGEAQR